MTVDELEPELATYEGFAARVEAAPGRWRQVGAGFVLLGIMLLLGSLVDGRGRYGLVALAVCGLPGVALTVLGGVTERRTLRFLHAAYLERGWLAMQVPTGLVLDLGGDSTIVRRAWVDARGGRERGNPVVLVSAPGQAPEVLEEAAVATVESLADLPLLEASAVTQRIQAVLPPWGGGDATRVFAVPDGTLLAERTGRSPFVVVVPPAHRSRKSRPRCYAVKEPLSARSARRRRPAAAAAR